jgi:hypothetical protein
MWIYVPGMEDRTSSASARDTEGLISESSWLFPLLERSVMWRSKPSLSRYWLRRCTPGSWMMRLCGRISRPLEARSGVDAWMASLVATPVLRSPAPASGEAWKTSGTFGPIFRESLPQLDLFGASSRTYPGMSASDSAKWCEAFKTWTTWLRQDCLQRQKLARATRGSGCSSLPWPTPAATDEQMDRRSEQKKQEWLDNPERGMNLAASAGVWQTPQSDSLRGGDRKDEQGLDQEARNWPTPAANDDNKTPEAHLAMKKRMGERDGTNANRTAITSLQVIVQNWPTARAEDAESCGNPAQDSLTGVTGNWTTPQAHDATGAASEQSKGKRREAGSKPGCRDLTSDVSQWPTASARDWKGKTTDPTGPDGRNRLDQLDRVAENFPCSPPGPATQPGPPSSQSGPTSHRPSKKRLNETFVGWLMGLPLGLLELTCSEQEGMAWSRSARATHSRLWRNGLGSR